MGSEFSKEDLLYFKERAIESAFAEMHGVRRVFPEEAAALGFRGPTGTMAGLYFPTRNALTGAETPGILRPDKACGCDAKYMRAKDNAGSERNRTLFWPALEKHRFEKESLFLCESPAKALALQSAIGGRGVCLGLNGVNGGWFSPREMVPAEDGGLREKKGRPRLVEDLERIQLLNRNVWIVFDNDVNDPDQAKRFKEHTGTLYAEAKLSELLRAKGAYVMLADFPFMGKKFGVDDLIATYGAAKVVSQIKTGGIARRDPAAVARNNGGLLTLTKQNDFRPPDDSAGMVGNIVSRGTVTLFASPPGFGKTFMMLGLLESLAGRSPCWGEFSVRGPARAIYLNYESPESLEGRALKFGFNLGDSLVHHVTEASYALNPKKRSFGKEEDIPENVANISKLRRTIHEIKADLLIIDNLGLATDSSENDELSAKDTMRVLLGIARLHRIAIVALHHTRKSRESENGYVAERLSGSGVWWRYADVVLIGERVGQETFRYRLSLAKVRDGEERVFEVSREQNASGFTGRMVLGPWKDRGGQIWYADEIRSVLEHFDDGQEVTVGEVSKVINGSRFAGSRVLKRMCSDGTAQNLRRGLYMIHRREDS